MTEFTIFVFSWHAVNHNFFSIRLLFLHVYDKISLPPMRRGVTWPTLWPCSLTEHLWRSPTPFQDRNEVQTPNPEKKDENLFNCQHLTSANRALVIKFWIYYLLAKQKVVYVYSDKTAKHVYAKLVTTTYIVSYQTIHFFKSFGYLFSLGWCSSN